MAGAAGDYLRSLDQGNYVKPPQSEQLKRRRNTKYFFAALILLLLAWAIGGYSISRGRPLSPLEAQLVGNWEKIESSGKRTTISFSSDRTFRDAPGAWEGTWIIEGNELRLWYWSDSPSSGLGGFAKHLVNRAVPNKLTIVIEIGSDRNTLVLLDGSKKTIYTRLQDE